MNDHFAFGDGDCLFTKEMFTAVAVLLKAGQEPPQASPSQVGEALDFIEKPSLKTLKKTVQATEVYEEIEPRILALQERSADDKIADCKLESAIRHLRVGRLPNIRVEVVGHEEKHLFLDNIEQVREGTILDVLEDVVSRVGEASGMWSPIRLQEQEAGAVECMKLLTKQLETLDFFLSANLYAKLREHDLGKVQTCCASNEGDIPALLAALRPVASAVVDNYDVDEDMYTLFMEKLATDKTINQAMSGAFAPMIKAVTDEFLHNGKLRRNVFTLMLHTQRLSSQKVPANTEETVADFKLRAASRVNSETFCSTALLLDRLWGVLEPDSEFHFPDQSELSSEATTTAIRIEACAVLQADGVDMLEELTSSPKVLVECFAPLRDGLRSLLHQSISASLQELAAETHTERVHHKAAEECDVSGLEGKSPMDAITMLVAVDKFFADRAWLRLGGKVAERETHVDTMIVLALDLTKDFADGKVSSEAHCMFTDIDECDPGCVDDMDGRDFFAMMNDLSRMSQIASCFAFVHTCFTDTKKMFNNFAVRGDLLQCIKTVDSCVHRMSLNEEEIARGSSKGIAWQIPPEDLKAWSTLAFAVNVHLKEQIMQVFAAALNDFAEQLDKFRPKISSYISDDTYLKAQAKRKLLETFNHAKLSDDTVTLCNALGMAETLRLSMGLEGVHG